LHKEDFQDNKTEANGREPLNQAISNEYSHSGQGLPEDRSVGAEPLVSGLPDMDLHSGKCLIQDEWKFTPDCTAWQGPASQARSLRG